LLCLVIAANLLPIRGAKALKVEVGWLLRILKD